MFGAVIRMRRLIATCFGLGWLPVAPGSWGSLPPAVVFGLLMYCHAPGIIAVAVMAAMMMAGCVACVLCAPAAVAATGKNDPSEVVVDEFAGQAVTFLAAPLLLPRLVTGWEGLLVAGIGFFAFRVLDISKPWPIRKLERLPAGWGILADDLAAGVGSAVVVYIGMRLLVRG